MIVYIYKALHIKINCLSATVGHVIMSSIMHQRGIQAQERGAVNNKPAALFSHKASSM